MPHPPAGSVYPLLHRLPQAHRSRLPSLGSSEEDDRTSGSFWGADGRFCRACPRIFFYLQFLLFFSLWFKVHHTNHTSKVRVCLGVCVCVWSSCSTKCISCASLILFDLWLKRRRNRGLLRRSCRASFSGGGSAHTCEFFRKNHS